MDLSDSAEFGSSPVVSGSVAYIGDLVDSLYAINVDTGKAKWVLKSDSGFAASPLLADETLIIGDLNGRVRWIDAHSGRVLRSFDIGEPIVASAKVADGLTIVPTEGGTVFAFDTKTSKLIWKSKIASQLQSAATVDGERLVFAGCDQKLLVLDPATGETRQSLEINSPTGATPAIHEGCIRWNRRW